MAGQAADYEQLLDGGYGYTGRVGFLSPGIVDETLSAQFYRMAPPGVTLVRTSLGLRDVTVGEVEGVLARTEVAATTLGQFKPDCICFGGSPTVAVPGFGSDKRIIETIEKASGIQAFAAQTAAIEALKLAGATRVAVATVFPDDVNEMVKDYLEKSGLEVAHIEGLNIPYVEFRRAGLRATYDLGKRCFAAAKNADALYFAAASQPCVNHIEPLEQELGTFVITSLQASLWRALTLLGIKDPITEYGKLLREMR